MAHPEQQKFCEQIKNEFPNFFENIKVLDVGSLDINGSNRELFINCEYVGVDIAEGKNVDIVSIAHELNHPDKCYDTIISTEAFEHDMYYEKTIQNIIRMLKPGGLFIFTCASIGRGEHGTLKNGPDAAPLLKNFGEWANYYKNLVESDFRKIDGFNDEFPNGVFVFNNYPYDIYFYGIKK